MALLSTVMSAVCVLLGPPSQGAPTPGACAQESAAPACDAACEAKPAPAAGPMVERVGGDLSATVTEKDGVYTASPGVFIDTPLPEGYPAPTPPGAIDLKRYPVVRRAEVTMDAAPGVAQNVAFWPLFNHIKERDIEMTAPVEMDVPSIERGRTGAGKKSPGSFTMAFLYRQREQGPEGKAGVVLVRDSEEATYLSLGYRGTYISSAASKMLAQLEEWLAGQSNWRRADDAPPRILGYNGPDRRPADRWGEIQVRVVPVEKVPQGHLDGAEPASAAAGAECATGR